MINQGNYDLRHDVDRIQKKVNMFESEYTNSYFIESNVPAIFYNDGFNPSTLIFSSYVNEHGKISLYKGILIVSSSVDGTTYSEIKRVEGSSISIQVQDNTIKFYKCQFYDTSNQLLDTQTIPLLQDGENGESPISIFLGNESQLIPCNSDGKVQDTISFKIPFYCYKGTKMYSCNFKPSTPNYFEELGFKYVLDKQCSAVNNGQITLTAIKDESFKGLKSSTVAMDFEVDNIIVTKYFNWAKVIDGKKGDDGQSPTLYCKYSELENPTSLDELSDVEQEGFIYQGIAWSYTGSAPTDVNDYKPFKKYEANDGIAGANGYVHIAYSNDPFNDNDTTFTTGTPTYTPLYMGTYTDNQPVDSQNRKMYTWTKIKGEDGVDGKTPSTDDIRDAIESSDIDASTLDGNSADNFLKVGIESDTFYRNESETNKNFVVAYKISNIVILQFYNFSGNKEDYGMDGEYHFKLMNTKLDPKFRPPRIIYANDLNNGANAKGTISVTTTGVCRKSVAGVTSEYNNTYGTIIYAVEDRTETNMSVIIDSGFTQGDTLKATLKDSKNNIVLANKPVVFKINNVNYTKYTDNNGVASININLNGGITYNSLVSFLGDEKYAPSSKSFDLTVNKPNGQIIPSGTSPYMSVDNNLPIRIQTTKGRNLVGTKVIIDGVEYTTNSEGWIFYRVTSNTQITITVPATNTPPLNRDVTKNITVMLHPSAKQNETRVPLNMFTTEVSSTKKDYDNKNIGRVQIMENSMAQDTAVYCLLNGSGYSTHSTPASAIFNMFKFSNQGASGTLTAKVRWGVFSTKGFTGGGGMVQPNVYIRLINTGGQDINIGTSEPPNDKKIEKGNTYYETIVTAENVSADNIQSDNLCVVVDGKQNKYTTNSSYNKAEFRIDYVELSVTY